MSNSQSNPNKRALRALIFVPLIVLAMWVAMHLVAVPGLIDCHRRGFEIIWDPLPSGCLIDASRGLPEHRW